METILLKWETTSSKVYKQLINTGHFTAWYSILSSIEPMKTNSSNDQLNACLQERRQLADHLQNEVNQTLASVLLWIQFAKIDNNLPQDKSLQQAETNLKDAIDRLRALHYALSQDV